MKQKDLDKLLEIQWKIFQISLDMKKVNKSEKFMEIVLEKMSEKIYNILQEYKIRKIMFKEFRKQDKLRRTKI